MNEVPRRRLLKIFPITFLALFLGGPAQAAPLLKPTKLGQVIIFQNRKYTAIKSGKNLVWNKGVPLPTPSSSASPASAKPVSSPTATPTPTPTQRTPEPTPSKTPYKGTKLGKSNELSMGQTKILAEPDPFGRGKKFAVTRTKNGIVVFDNTCTHEGCAVEVLTKNELECPCHGAQFNAITGEATRKPAYQGLTQIRAEEIDGEIVAWIYG